MDDIPSISTGAVGSRFISQGDIDEAKARRDEQWKAAYARSFAELQSILLPQLTPMILLSDSVKNLHRSLLRTFLMVEA